MGAKRALVDPVTGLLWLFDNRIDALNCAPPGLAVHNGWRMPDGRIVISTFGRSA